MITITYPRHKVEYEDVPEMLDYELADLFDDHVDVEDMEDRERKRAIKVLNNYKNKLEQD